MLSITLVDDQVVVVAEAGRELLRVAIHPLESVKNCRVVIEAPRSVEIERHVRRGTGLDSAGLVRRKGSAPPPPKPAPQNVLITEGSQRVLRRDT